MTLTYQITDVESPLFKTIICAEKISEDAVRVIKPSYLSGMIIRDERISIIPENEVIKYVRRRI